MNLPDTIIMIDKAFDTPGYARNHPELVGAVLDAMAAELHTLRMEEVLSELAGTLRRIGLRIEQSRF